jgi:hypothetical protein
MHEQEIMKKLREEGFSQTYVWEDWPNASYPEHTHASETAHVILRCKWRVKRRPFVKASVATFRLAQCIPRRWDREVAGT